MELIIGHRSALSRFLFQAHCGHSPDFTLFQVGFSLADITRANLIQRQFGGQICPGSVFQAMAGVLVQMASRRQMASRGQMDRTFRPAGNDRPAWQRAKCLNDRAKRCAS
ncbi:MAG: hypothetical protein ACOYLN_14400, partial [Blastocatellia bacterium]